MCSAPRKMAADAAAFWCGCALQRPLLRPFKYDAGGNGSGLHGFADVNPLVTAGKLLQFRYGEPDSAVFIAGGGIDHVKPLQRVIQEHADPVFYGERTDAAGSMSDICFHFLPWNHFCLLVEGFFIFMIVYFYISGRYNQDRAVICKE